MSDQSKGFTFEDHQRAGEGLKWYADSIERLRADLAYSYPQSAKKEMKQLETAFNNIKLVQASLHSRLLAEHSDKADDELLPVYLGRLNSQNR
jgi:hypothetical protein